MLFPSIYFVYVIALYGQSKAVFFHRADIFPVIVWVAYSKVGGKMGYYMCNQGCE